jgi:hypothetical protein
MTRASLMERAERRTRGSDLVEVRAGSTLGAGFRP